MNTPLLDTDPMAAVPETHGAFTAGVPLPVNCKVLPTHTLPPPEMLGLGFTVTVCCAVVAHCPADGVKVYVVVWVLFTAGDHVP